MLTDDEETTKDYEEKLKAAMLYSIGKICEERSKRDNVEFTPTFLASLTEVLYAVSQEWARDLECFAIHAKRQTINHDDIKLLLRKNESLMQQMDAFIKPLLESSSKKDQPPRKRAKKTMKAEKNATLQESFLKAATSTVPKFSNVDDELSKISEDKNSDLDANINEDDDIFDL